MAHINPSNKEIILHKRQKPQQDPFLVCEIVDQFHHMFAAANGSQIMCFGYPLLFASTAINILAL